MKWKYLLENVKVVRKIPHKENVTIKKYQIAVESQKL